MIYKLEDICVKVCSGGTPNRKHTEYYSDGSIPWLNTGEINFNRIKSTVNHITELGLNKSSAKWVPENTVIVAMYGATAGRSAITKIPLTTNQACCNLIIDEHLADYRYVYYYLYSKYEHIASLANGGAQQNLNAGQIKEYLIDLPSLDIQQKVADILESLDNKIEQNKQINDNLLQQCATLYDEICSTAEVALMSDLVAVVETGSRPKGGAQTSGIPSIGAEKIERFGTYDYSGEKFISEEYFSKLKRGIITSGDVLLYKDGAYTGKSSMALDGFPHVKCAVNEHVFIIRTLNKKYQYFLYFTLQNDDIRKMIHGLACGKAAQPGLNQPELLSVSIKLPPKDVLETFEEQVNPLMHQIALNALESKHLSALQDAILPKLMSGEIDVSSIELD